MNDLKEKRYLAPPLWAAVVPVGVLLGLLVIMIVMLGADSVQVLGPWVLLFSALTAMAMSAGVGALHWGRLREGLMRSVRQVAPSLPILFLIGAISSTWMLSGVVPLMIKCGLHVLDPDFFLVTACVVSALISVLTGSSWTTIATIGVAFMGIGSVMGFSGGWIAGAVISGAYFGDKISPLSDTTVLASSSSGVGLFTHIKYMMLTTIPSMVITVVVFAVAGFATEHGDDVSGSSMVGDLGRVFNLTPWLLVVPAGTGVLIALRANPYLTLGLSSLLGLGAMLVFQPGVVATLGGGLEASLRALVVSTELSTPSELLDSLVATGGMVGMLPTVWLVGCAMVFGGVMIGSGMLGAITDALTRKIKSARSTVSATVVSGLALNACTGDQYLSIIINSNIYRPMYERNGLQKRLLSRTVEDSVSVTSVLIPWNSCGLAQSSVLGVATLTYVPFCVFNIVSPLMSLGMAWAGIKIRKVSTAS